MASTAFKNLMDETLLAATLTGEKVSLENYMEQFIGLLTVSGRTADSYTCKIQYSADGTTWADWISFTATSSNGGEHKLPTLDTVPTYVRAVATLGAAGTANVKIDLYYSMRK